MSRERADAGDALDRPAAPTRLEAEVAALREELARLLEERDTLLQQVKPLLTARYLAAVGWKELQLFELEVEVRGLRRRVELLQAAANRGQRLPWNQIEAAVAAELAEWHIEVERRAAAIERARRCLGSLLTQEETRELRTLYRTLARRLHPDVAGPQDDGARALWARVVEAWKNADLTEMRALALLTPEAEPALSGASAESAKASLQAACRAVIAEIAAARAEFPFTLADSLDDPSWVAARISEIEAREPELVEQREALQGHLDSLRGAVAYD